MITSFLLLSSLATVGQFTYTPYQPTGKFLRPDQDPYYQSSWNVDSIIPKGYNRLIPPQPGPDMPVRVKITLNISQILSVKEDEQSFTIHAHYSQEWRDPRIRLPDGLLQQMDSLGLDFTWRERIWVPDTYFHNAIGGEGISILAAPYNFVLYNDSRIVMKLRSVIKLTCDMNLRMFPHDTQTCDVILVSCKPTRVCDIPFKNLTTKDFPPQFSDDGTVLNTRKQVEFEWGNFDLVERLDFPKFSIEKVFSSECTIHGMPGYYCAKASIFLRRRWEYYTIRIYGPSLLLVVTSFIGFFIPLMGYPARVAIVVTPLLSLITQQTQINAEINVNYVVSLHVWMMTCTFFVFICLLELGFAVIYKHRVEERISAEDTEKSLAAVEEKKKCENKLQLPTSDRPVFREKRRLSADILKPEVNKWVKNLLLSIYGHIDWYKAPTDRNKVDYVARVLFPTSFCMFVFIYTLVIYKNID